MQSMKDAGVQVNPQFCLSSKLFCNYCLTLDTGSVGFVKLNSRPIAVMNVSE